MAEAFKSAGTSPPASPYLTPSQVATMLQVDVRTVLRWASSDASMPATRISPRVLRFERQALDRWLERRQQRRSRTAA
jgi:excisionase family DNA binding protein